MHAHRDTVRWRLMYTGTLLAFSAALVMAVAVVAVLVGVIVVEVVLAVVMAFDGSGKCDVLRCVALCHAASCYIAS